MIVLNQIDNIGQSDDVLYGLPRARSNGYVDDVPVRSRDLYERYVKICDRLDADSVSERRVRDHLSDMGMLGLISVYERNEGLSAGRYHEYELDVPLKAILEALLSTTRFEELADIIQSTADDNNLLQSDISDY